MSSHDILNDRIAALRGTTADVRTIAGLLLLAPGGALAGSGLLAGLHGTARTFAEMALIVAVSITIPIGAAIWPRRPAVRRQSVEQILADASLRADGTRPASEMLASEVQRLQEIVDAKWRWIRVAIGLGGLALVLGASAVIAAGQ